MVSRFLQISFGVVALLLGACGCANNRERIKASVFEARLERYTQLNRLEIVADRLEVARHEVSYKMEQLKTEQNESEKVSDALIATWMKLMSLEGRVDRTVSACRRDLVSIRVLYKPANWSEISGTVNEQINRAELLYKEVMKALAETNQLLEKLQQRSTPPHPRLRQRFRSYYAQVRAQDESPVLTCNLDAINKIIAATIMPLPHVFVSEKNLFSLLG